MTKEVIPPDSREIAMIYMIDSLAKRYGKLPNKIMTEATTFDLFIMDSAISYEGYLQDQAEKNNKRGIKKESKEYDVDDLQQMLNKVKEAK